MSNLGIRIENVSYGYVHNTMRLSQINTFIPQGSFFGITGVNGSGKTTFAYLLNGLIPQQIEGKYLGNVTIDGINTRERPVSFFARKVGFVFQNPDFMIFNLTVKEEIAFGLQNLGFKDIDHRINEALREVGLEGCEDRDPHTLSLGQKQKVCLASVLAMDTPYVVLDEPTAMLDHVSALGIYKLLDTLHSKGKTIIVVEHDTDFLLTHADKIIVLDNGEIVLEGTSEIFDHTVKLRSMGIKLPRIVSYE